MPRWSVCVDGTACSAPAAGTGGHHPWPPGASISVLSVQASPQADLAHGENDLSCDRLPLATWFAAIRLIATARNGISSVELGRCPVIGWPTAWTMKQKTMAVMVRREGKSRPPGRVEIDDACLRRGAHAVGRAADTKPSVAAVSAPTEGGQRKVKLTSAESL